MSKPIIYYDNLFTSNLFTGSRNGLNLTSDNLTRKHWAELSLDRPYNNVFNKGAFFVIKTFTPEESAIIVSSIKEKKKTIYFDQYGNLIIFEEPLISSSTPKLKINFINKTAYEGMNVNYSNPSGIMEFDKNENPNLILSKFNTYILNLFDKTKVQILYNPLHRKPFKQFYKSLYGFLNDNGFNSPNSTNTDDLQSLVDKYCEIMAVEKTVNGNRKYADKTCKCLGTNSTRTYGKTELGLPDPVGECIDDAIGHIVNNSIRSQVGLNCVCAANSCKSGDGNFEEQSSFLPDFRDRVRPIKDCPNITNTFCSTIITAGGSIDAKGAQLSQACGENTEYKKAIAENDEKLRLQQERERAAAEEEVRKQRAAAEEEVRKQRAAAEEERKQRAAAEEERKQRAAAEEERKQRAAAAATTPKPTTPPPAPTTPPPAPTTPPPSPTTPPPAPTTPPPAPTTPPPAPTTPPPAPTTPPPAPTTPPPAPTTPPPAATTPPPAPTTPPQATPKPTTPAPATPKPTSGTPPATQDNNLPIIIGSAVGGILLIVAVVFIIRKFSKKPKS
jgi:hypothetical protein